MHLYFAEQGSYSFYQIPKGIHMSKKVKNQCSKVLINGLPNPIHLDCGFWSILI